MDVETSTGRSDPRLPARLVVVTGGQGSGKTTGCASLLARAERLGLDCAGLLSPARIEGGAQAGYDVIDLRTGDRRSWARADPEGTLGGSRWRFDPEVAIWASDRLADACPCDVLVVDELGPLEIRHLVGWSSALGVLRSGRFGLGVVVVRPSLIRAFLAAIDQPLDVPILRPADLLCTGGDLVARALLSRLEARYALAPS